DRPARRADRLRVRAVLRHRGAHRGLPSAVYRLDRWPCLVHGGVHRPHRPGCRRPRGRRRHRHRRRPHAPPADARPRSPVAGGCRGDDRQLDRPRDRGTVRLAHRRRSPPGIPPQRTRGPPMSATIRSVEAFSVAYPEPNDSDATRYLTFASVTTDDGVVGWGEAVTMHPGVSRATEKLIESLAERVIGRDVADTERI